jgi:hypothetical protein
VIVYVGCCVFGGMLFIAQLFFVYVGPDPRKPKKNTSCVCVCRFYISVYRVSVYVRASVYLKIRIV